MIRVTCLGAAGSVTGSCYLVESSHGRKILVDCGLFQGGKQIEARNWKSWGFDPAEINTVLITHAHLDHIGRLPKLVRDGFSGKVITSHPTAELSRIMLLDSAHIQEMDSEWQNRKNRRKNNSPVKPLYSTEDAEKTLNFIKGVDRDQKIEIEPGFTARFRNAGHILGSSIIELWVEDENETKKIIFSGDIGKNDQLIVKDPELIHDADYVFIESTYGDRLHRSFDDSKEELLEAINYAVENGEKIIIPAFAVERTQEILYILGEFSRQGKLPDIPIYLDSPLAIKATEIFRNNTKYYDDKAKAILASGEDPFSLPRLQFTPDARQSADINELDGSAIVIAGSGMCNAGRIKHHLKHNLWKPGASIVFVGYQAAGTTGRMILEGKKWVKIFWQSVAVKARVFSIGGFSAHADQAGLLEWLSNFKDSRPMVFVMHGEPDTSKKLAENIRHDLGLQAHVPMWREKLNLTAAVSEQELFPADERQYMLSQSTKAIQELEAELRRLKEATIKAAQNDQLSDDDLERLETALEELKGIMPEVINTEKMTI